MSKSTSRVVVALLCLAAIAALLYWLVRPSSSVTLAVRVQLADGGTALASKDSSVHEGEQLRFEVKATRPSEVYVLGLDVTGRVSLYVPSTGTAPKVKASTSTLLEDRINVDGVLGAERMLALACPEKTDVGALVSEAQRALTAAENHPEKVKTLRTTCGLDWFELKRVAR